MDVLSDVLSWIRVEGTLSRRSELSAPWGIIYPPNAHYSFLVVESGSCFLLRESEEPFALETGDLVMFSPGNQVALVSQPTAVPVPYASVLAARPPSTDDKYALNRCAYPTLQYGGGGRVTAIRGWGLRFEGLEQHPLLALLPPMFHISYEQRSALPWLETTLRFLLHETHEQGDGSDMMSVRLVDLLFVQVIRAWFQQQPEGEAGWLGALRDPSMGHALKLMHQYPADPWTVQGLSKAIGMSRSSFSSRFQALVGAPPLRYLTRLRMNLAAIALSGDTRLSLAEVSRQVGYDGESSFGRAFKRHFGVSPGGFRKRSRSSDSTSESA